MLPPPPASQVLHSAPVDVLVTVPSTGKWLAPAGRPEGPAQKNSQGVPWIFLDISTAFFIPAAVFYMLGLCRNFIRRLPLLSNIKVLHALDSQSHGILARRDFGT